MPQQDYVKTARPAPRGRKKTNQKKPLPVLLIAVVVALLLGFAAFLWHISHRPGAEAAATEAKKTVETSQTANQEALPPKPAKEPYTYIKELQNKEIQVEAEQLKAKAPANMYCGTFKAIEGAQQLKAKMAFVGVASEIRQSSGKYRVVSGPYASKRQAQSDKNKLLQQKIADCWVI